MNYNEFLTEDLIDALPQNRPLYKDSGSWTIRGDDMETIYAMQTNETFREFIIRYIEWLANYPDEIIDVDTDLAIKKLKY